MLDLFEFEAVLDDTGGGPAPADTAPDTAADAADAPEAAAETVWAPSQGDWEQIQQQLQAVQTAVTPAPVVEEQQFTNYLVEDQTTGETAIDPNALRQYINEQITVGVQQQVQPYQPVLDATVRERGETVVTAKLAELAPTFPHADPALSRAVAEGLLPQIGDPNQAIRQGVNIVHDVIARERAAAVEEYKQTLKNIGDAPNDGGSAGGASVERVEPRSGMNGYRDVERNFLARHGVTP